MVYVSSHPIYYIKIGFTMKEGHKPTMPKYMKNAHNRELIFYSNALSKLILLLLLYMSKIQRLGVIIQPMEPP
jgi:hypothetical protein